uniref:O-fucosyltransferase family protein n=1 Tax=Ananas comosus var. bracteatus TaxID=296719 RepID=A0A6V7P7H2_ANACO|nr:unnamed protein product [Ananas comosus var. bracteatus]
MFSLGIYKNSGYLMVSCNGGLNQMRAAICDMVTVARYLNVTLIVPELDKTSFWADTSDFQDIFDVDHFINSLRDEVQILKHLPPRLKRRVELGMVYSMPPVCWSDISYYQNQVFLCLFQVIHLNRTDARLANNGLPIEIHKMRCRVNYANLKFTSQIEELSPSKWPFFGSPLTLRNGHVGLFRLYPRLHGRRSRRAYENEICLSMVERESYQLLFEEERRSLSFDTRKDCSCSEALDIDRSVQIYIAAGEIYSKQKRMAALTAAYPDVLRKETILEPSDLRLFQNHSSQMAALDYLVSLESDVFVPTYDGNMAKVVEGHRRCLGFRKTILLNRKLIVELVDRYNSGILGGVNSPLR